MIRYTAQRPNIATGAAPVPRVTAAAPEEPAKRRRVDPVLKLKKRSELQLARADRLHEILVRAAGAGAPCPSNNELCDRLGITAAHLVSPVFHLLEQQGRIRVRRYQTSRQVEIVATGKRTAEPKGVKTAHWRFR